MSKFGDLWEAINIIQLDTDVSSETLRFLKSKALDLERMERGVI